MFDNGRIIKDFTINMKCNKCESLNIKTELDMAQASGLLVLKCQECENKSTLTDEDFN